MVSFHSVQPAVSTVGFFRLYMTVKINLFSKIYYTRFVKQNSKPMANIKWQDAQIGDSARVIETNVTGLITFCYGRRFNIKFIDGTEKTFDKNELEFFNN